MYVCIYFFHLFLSILYSQNVCMNVFVDYFVCLFFKFNNLFSTYVLAICSVYDRQKLCNLRIRSFKYFLQLAAHLFVVFNSLFNLCMLLNTFPKQKDNRFWTHVASDWSLVCVLNWLWSWLSFSIYWTSYLCVISLYIFNHEKCLRSICLIENIYSLSDNIQDTVIKKCHYLENFIRIG